MYIAAAFCGIAVLAIDQFTKYYVSSHFVIGETRKFLNGFIDLTYIHNEGAAWGMLSGKTYALLAITLAVMVMCVIIFIKYGKKSRRYPIFILLHSCASLTKQVSSPLLHYNRHPAIYQ